MKKSYRKVITVVAAVALLGVGFAACAGQVDKTPEERVIAMVDSRVEAALDDIDATDEQRTQVHELKEQLIEEFKGAREEHEASHEVVEELWLAEEADAEKAHRLVDERIEKMRKKAHLVTDAAIELHGILTPEQRQILADRAKERRNSWRHRWHGDSEQ
ncbi:MAG: Spy/CpxP family protein refolding chaperone [Deltaproteobacteria bacterium]|jgi:Spy/CpxP family protein refolding chaperone|nr:Spy/CpxP family protein refolding chaperone [Deltaproteobacteria bacterium]MBW2529900.1 Spy/CpxP family protein refolding chaperone [Deltaproteobacteria bacterium]